jgi:ribosomal protein S18 acetylase RimI-like enzyme
MDVICDRPEHLAEFIRLNEIWIQEHFSLESADRALAADPGAIARAGGHTICAVEEGSVVGVVALFRRGEGQFELARMAVEPNCRGRGIGRILALSAIQKAVGRKAKTITLLSNTALGPAISLYRSLGFRVVHTGQHLEYARCNVVMEKTLGKGGPSQPSFPLAPITGLAGKRFRLVENSTSGVASTNTVLSFTSDDDVIVGHYEGGSVLVGHVLARRIGNYELEMLYQGATTTGQIRSGMATASLAENGGDGMTMTLQWRWTSGDSTSGTSFWTLVS